jgi:hypothetical protein
MLNTILIAIILFFVARIWLTLLEISVDLTSPVQYDDLWDYFLEMLSNDDDGDDNGEYNFS